MFGVAGSNSAVTVPPQCKSYASLGGGFLEAIEQASQSGVLHLLTSYPGPGVVAQQQDGHTGMAGAELLQPRGLILAVRYHGHPGGAARRHCITCQCARMFRSSSSGVDPVSTSPALLIADQNSSSTPKAW